ncbi:MAG: hypothetical protein ACT6Q7_01840 [Blastomonas fulva]|uniref:hypothetical protein n=1 Tax=Blastomonas fulva TaxID=1550728 RepID=UPI0040345F84
MKGWYVELDGKQVPRCYCCGSLAFQGPLRLVMRSTQGEREFRCEKHVERLPCVIVGCGRTYGFQPGDHYGVRVVCGKHWRQAPAFMRAAVSRVRSIGRKRGWTMALSRRHERLWLRTVRAIDQGHNLDIAAIEREFGL